MLYEETTNNCKNISRYFEQIREILERMISKMSDEEIKKIKIKYEDQIWRRKYMIWTILSWIMSGIALIGSILNSSGNKYGFIFWIISNLYMSIRFYAIGEYAQALLFAIYFIIAIRGLNVWSKKKTYEDIKSWLFYHLCA